MPCPTAIWERLRAANFHCSSLAASQSATGALGGQQQGKDISLRDGVFVPVRKTLGSLQKSTYGQREFVLVQETHWTEPLPASGCHTGRSSSGMGSGRVWPCVQLQPAEEMVKQGCGGDPCLWRVGQGLWLLLLPVKELGGIK